MNDNLNEKSIQNTLGFRVVENKKRFSPASSKHAGEQNPTSSHDI